MINRSQGIVLGFFAGALVSLAAILAFAPSIYANVLKVPAGAIALEAGFLAALVAFIAFVSIGVFRRWRWMFWLIVIAFLAGILRVPASILEWTGFLPTTKPDWYVLFQGVIGVIQLAIGLALLWGYRKAGPWGAF